MRTIEALEKEIEMQVDFVEKFVPPKMLSLKEQRRAIFCGSGDSFASAHLAQSFSAFRASARDPLELMGQREAFAGRDLYLISVSGNTVSNICLAKMHKRTTAITADKESRLARSCRNTIPLKFCSAGIQTAGSISFLASALACISLVSEHRIKDPARIYREAVRAARRVSLTGKVYLLGNVHTLPIAMFCAAKLYEVLGSDAHYERIEQLLHAVMFSARRGDTVILFEPKNRHNERLLKNLRKSGLRVKRLEPTMKRTHEQILFFIFVSELIVLYAAKKRKKKDCFFIDENELRNASSSMIY